jgi:hypothetical protein
MTKFNLKEHIAKNKSTFFGSLNEGQFSWMTQDTGQQIGSQDANKIPVYMFDNKGKYWFEREYEGYGEFGGKDYYELLDQMNGGEGDRSRGIDLAFGEIKTSSPILFPALVVGASNFNYKTHDFTKEAEHDPNQSWYDASYEEEDEDEDYGGFGDMDREEDYDYSDEEELEEGFQGQFYAPEYLEQKYGKEIASKITAEIDEMDENSYDRFTEFTSAEEVEDYISDIKDMMDLNEGEAAYEYEKGKTAGEKIEKTKMKKSELKAKIKEMIIAEINIDVDNETSEYDFLKEIEDMLNEAEGDEEVDAEEVDTEAAADAGAEEEVDTTVDITTDEVDPNVKSVQDALTQAQAAAQQLGDKKLMDQIGNTITFFTRAHVVEKPKGAVAEGEEYDDYEDDGFDLDAEFANSPNQASFEDVFNVIQSYENDEILDDFTSKFPSIKPVNKEKYLNFTMNYIDDMSERDYIKANWVSMFDEDVYEKAGLAENEKSKGTVAKGKKMEEVNEAMFPMLKKILK